MIQKVGLGYDIHRFVENRKLFLGGVEISYHLGLDGHSDADVVLHAICDAILGALGKGDIGEHFPNNDPQYKGISSNVLLGNVNDVLKKEGYKIDNIDTMIQAEEPNLKQYKSLMKQNIAEVLGLRQDQINIKATTQERLGAIGQKQGIAAFAICLLTK